MDVRILNVVISLIADIIILALELLDIKKWSKLPDYLRVDIMFAILAFNIYTILLITVFN